MVQVYFNCSSAAQALQTQYEAALTIWLKRASEQQLLFIRSSQHPVLWIGALGCCTPVTISVRKSSRCLSHRLLAAFIEGIIHGTCSVSTGSAHY